jgi:hypothetical protein
VAGSFHTPLQRFTLDVDFSDLGSGASDSIALTGFPTDVIIVARALEIVTAFAGEADLACSGGDTGDADGQFASITIHALAAGWVDIVPGAESGARYEGDYATDGGDLTFSATELDDVTAGALKYHIFYFTPKLSTD